MKQHLKDGSPVHYRMKGVSLYGKYATVLLTDTAIQVHTTPAWLFILCAWVFAMVGFFVGMLFEGMLMVALLSVGLATVGALLVWNLFTGKMRERYAYNDIVSFVSAGGEMTISMKNNKLYALRMLPKKQELLMDELRQVMEEHTDFVLKKESNYYRVYPKKEAGEQK